MNIVTASFQVPYSQFPASGGSSRSLEIRLVSWTVKNVVTWQIKLPIFLKKEITGCIQGECVREQRMHTAGICAGHVTPRDGFVESLKPWEGVFL